MFQNTFVLLLLQSTCSFSTSSIGRTSAQVNSLGFPYFQVMSSISHHFTGINIDCDRSKCAYKNHTRNHSWNQPMLNNGGKWCLVEETARAFDGVLPMTSLTN